jgi:osmotically-inducible protein OsmY
VSRADFDDGGRERFITECNSKVRSIMSKLKIFSSAVIGAVLIGSSSGCAVSGMRGLSGSPGDDGISAHVRAQLSQYPSLRSSDSLRVQTYGRVVYLTGQAATDEQRDLAESVTSEVAGVVRVVDTISVSFPGA